MRPLKDIFHEADYPDLLVGLEVADDAAVYRINDEVAIIQVQKRFLGEPDEYGLLPGMYMEFIKDSAEAVQQIIITTSTSSMTAAKTGSTSILSCLDPP